MKKTENFHENVSPPNRQILALFTPSLGCSACARSSTSSASYRIVSYRIIYLVTQPTRHLVSRENYAAYEQMQPTDSRIEKALRSWFRRPPGSCAGGSVTSPRRRLSRRHICSYARGACHGDFADARRSASFDVAANAARTECCRHTRVALFREPASGGEAGNAMTRKTKSQTIRK